MFLKTFGDGEDTVTDQEPLGVKAQVPPPSALKHVLHRTWRSCRALCQPVEFSKPPVTGALRH